MLTSISKCLAKTLPVCGLFGVMSTIALGQTHKIVSSSPQGNPIHISFANTGKSTVTTASATFTNLVQGSGPVMRNPTNYLIFWQPPGRAAFPAGYRTGIETFFQKVGGTPFYNIVTEYNDKSGSPAPTNSTSWGGSWVDTATAPPSGCNGSNGPVGTTPNCPLTDADIQAEVTAAIAANPSWGPPSLSREYFVFTPSDTNQCAGPDAKDPTKYDCFAINTPLPSNGIAAYCAYHTYFSSNTIYAYQPFAGNGNCLSGFTTPNNLNLDTVLSAASHEMLESNTDPLINGWKGTDGNDDEIGDKCAYIYGFVAPDGTNTVLNSVRYQIQEEFSNSVTACTKRYDPPAASLTTPASLIFAPALPGSSQILPVPVNNGGPGDADILYIRLSSASDPGFSLIGVTFTWATLPPAGSMTPNVKFAPALGRPPANATGTFLVDTDYTSCSVINISCTSAASGELSVPLQAAVVNPPSIAKAFPGATIPINQDVVLTFQIANPNTIAITGVGFNDPLLNGLVVSTPSVVTDTCGGLVTANNGGASISLANGSIAASSTCTVTVKVKGTVAGSVSNTTTNVTSIEAGNGNTATASTTVALPPVITKNFSLVAVPPGAATQLTFSIKNPNTTVSLTTSFTDTLATPLVVATPNSLSGSCFGGTITAVAGSSAVSLAGAIIPASATCTFSVNIVATTETGKVANSVTVQSVEGGTGNTATASIFAGSVFFDKYISDLNIGDSFVNMTNAGSIGGDFNVSGDICANVYVVDPAQEVVACCACPMTPGHLKFYSAQTDLAANLLTPGTVTAFGTQILVTSGPTCNAATVTTSNLALGGRAWATTVHQTPTGDYTTTETPFAKLSLNADVLSKLTTFCGYIQSGGSGYGVCKNCQQGAK